MTSFEHTEFTDKEYWCSSVRVNASDSILLVAKIGQQREGMHIDSVVRSDDLEQQNMRTCTGCELDLDLILMMRTVPRCLIHHSKTIRGPKLTRGRKASREPSQDLFLIHVFDHFSV